MLSKFTDIINENLNNKKHVLIVFVDYSKAFETLRHDRLLESLDDSGIRGSLLDWCKNYLENRKYHVRVGDVFSDEQKVSQGTAQGSVLGPLHYITYVNSVCNVIQHCEILQYADDTCLIAAHSDVNNALQHLQRDFTSLMKWSHDAGLVLNANKTKLMYISSSQNRNVQPINLIAHEHVCLHSANDQITCLCPAIQNVEQQTYLGLIIDSRLKWTAHINAVCDKLRALLAKFTLIKDRIPYPILLNLYKALGESIISYGVTSYGLTCKTHLNMIYELQLRILKIIAPRKLKSSFENDYSGLFYHCRVLPIHDRIKYALLLDNYFNENIAKIHNNDTRTRKAKNKLLNLPNYKNLYGKYLLNYKIPSLLNELPITLKDNLSQDNLKRKLWDHFIDNLKPK